MQNFERRKFLFKEAFEKQVQETIHRTTEIDIDAEINFADIKN
jgi:hypothetical protein